MTALSTQNDKTSNNFHVKNKKHYCATTNPLKTPKYLCWLVEIALYLQSLLYSKNSTVICFLLVPVTHDEEYNNVVQAYFKILFVILA